MNLAQRIRKKTFRRNIFVGFTAVWLIAVVSLTLILTYYSGLAGEPAQAASKWPATSAIDFRPNSETLLVFIHPKCSCSRATLHELNRLLPLIKNKVSVKLIFDLPIEKDFSWIEGANLKLARSLPDVQIIFDQNSYERNLFRVKTSGQALLFSKEKTLLFAGGITPARAHMGDSKGRDIILENLDSKNRITLNSAVFGCCLTETITKYFGSIL